MDQTMVKLMIIGRRRPGTTLAQHRHHIKDVHGRLVLEFVAVDPANAPQRYTQNHVYDGTFRGTSLGSDPFALNRDFVNELWFKDVQSITRSNQQPFYIEHLSPDEDNFVDQDNVVMMPVVEREVRVGAVSSDAYKVFLCLSRQPDCELDDFRHAWSELPLALAKSPLAAIVRREVQNDVQQLPGQTVTPLDGIDAFWLDDEASANQLVTWLQEWLADTLIAQKIVDAATPFVLLAHEYPLHKGASINDAH